MAAAARNHHQVLKQTFRLFTPRGVEGLSTPRSSANSEELDESDVWNCQPESRKKPAAGRPRGGASKKPEASAPPPCAASVPVNVPDWQKILLHEYKSGGYKERNADDDEDDDEEEAVEGDARRLPPHEIVMRRRAEPRSVVEGAGRTLKGRDLSRVRNAVWARTGFQD